MIPFALSPSTLGGATVLSSVRSKNRILPQFSNLFQKAQANAPHETWETPEPKSLVRKATGKQSADPHSAKPDNQQTSPVQFVPGQQLEAIPLRFSFFPAAGLLLPSDGKSPVEAATGSTDPGGSSEAAPQQALALSTVAFSINLEKFGTPDQKPAEFGHQNTESTQSAQASAPPAGISSQTGESSSPNTGSHQPGTEERDPADPKMESAGAIQQAFTPAAPHDIQPLASSANTAMYSTNSVETRRAEGDIATAAQSITATQPPAMPVLVSPRHIDLTVPNSAGHPVDIRISQRGSDVQVTVRTLDGSLAQSLRHHLPELSENLSRNGLQEELLNSAQSQSSETPTGRGQRQDQQNSGDRNRPPAKSGVKDQASGSFAEMIQTEKRNN